MVRTMNAPVAALLVICLLAVPARCLAQESTDSADANLSQEEWRRRIDEARRRTDEFVANARNRKAEPFSADDLRKEKIERARRDPTLRQGDIVATERGFEMFVGNEEGRQSGDFVPVPSSK
jgi:hypothetical protein